MEVRVWGVSGGVNVGKSYTRVPDDSLSKEGIVRYRYSENQPGPERPVSRKTYYQSNDHRTQVHRGWVGVIVPRPWRTNLRLQTPPSCIGGYHRVLRVLSSIRIPKPLIESTFRTLCGQVSGFLTDPKISVPKLWVISTLIYFRQTLIRLHPRTQ